METAEEIMASIGWFYQDGLYKQAGEWRMDYEIDGQIVTATLAKDDLDIDSARMLAEAWNILAHDLYGAQDKPYTPAEVEKRIADGLKARERGVALTPSISMRFDKPRFEVWEKPTAPETTDMLREGLFPILDLDSMYLEWKRTLIAILREEYALDLIEMATRPEEFGKRQEAKRRKVVKSLQP